MKNANADTQPVSLFDTPLKLTPRSPTAAKLLDRGAGQVFDQTSRMRDDNGQLAGPSSHTRDYTSDTYDHSGRDDARRHESRSPRAHHPRTDSGDRRRSDAKERRSSHDHSQDVRRKKRRRDSDSSHDEVMDLRELGVQRISEDDFS